ncbi:MAG: class I SAM-dependent methyltransferase [Burkholderiales bacterium]|nr:class I SAM-dependent methyltransferase [Burkholderiales bacterium]
MRPELFDEMAAVQQTHWWFVARREILASVIQRLNLPPRPDILEIGCGTGANLAMLSEHGHVVAMEYDDVARGMAAKLAVCVVQAGGLPEPVPFADGTFDLVCLLDVLEHIEADAAAMTRVARLLKPGGRVLLTVPAYGWLWSAHDTAHHHHRRYTASAVRSLAGQAGLVVQRVGYFNTLLFPLIAGARLLGKLLSLSNRSDAALPNRWVNALLRLIFASERHVVAHTGFPWGVSVIAVMTARQE